MLGIVQNPVASTPYSVSGTLAKTAPPPGFFPLGSGAVFVYAIVELRGKACDQIRPIRLGRPRDSAGI